jgi:polyisoprenoid-binding protein YceI
MKRIFAPIILLLLVVNAFAQVKTTVTKSKITFEIKNLGIKTGGSIGGLQATVQFDPAHLNTSSVEASVDPKTVNTDNDGRDEHLRSDEFFDAARFPKITMKSVSFKHKSGDKYEGQFNLTLKDKTKLVNVPFTYTDAGATVAIKGSFKLNRLDFGLGGSSLVLSDEVVVNIEVEMAKGE